MTSPSLSDRPAHTAETVRAACERAGIRVSGNPIVGQDPDVWRVTDIPGRQHLIVEYSAGDLWWNGRLAVAVAKMAA